MADRICSYSGEVIEPGTGLMYVKRNGEVYNYKTRKCFREHQTLKRVPRYVRWTKQAQSLKAERTKKSS